MKKRGRPSAASLVVAAAVLERTQRLLAPHDLTDEETEVWAAVVNDHPADWFSLSAAPLLVQYCRHSVQARRIAEMIERATSDPDLSIKDYDRLLKMQERESRCVASLATKMRITNQALTNHRGNKVNLAEKKPWEA